MEKRHTTTIRLPESFRRRIKILQAVGYDINLTSLAEEGIESVLRRYEKQAALSDKAFDKWYKDGLKTE